MDFPRYSITVLFGAASEFLVARLSYPKVIDAKDQRTALETLAQLALKDTLNPDIRNAALAMTRGCKSRDDLCELQAIYDAVKHGTSDVAGLEDGLRYVADPRWSDYFVAPSRTLDNCERGSCGGDCDDHAGLIAALAGSIGFKVGLRAWGEKQGGVLSKPEYTHVYAVIALPKRGPFTKVVGMDTTVPTADVGWEPPGGDVLTAWLE